MPAPVASLDPQEERAVAAWVASGELDDWNWALLAESTRMRWARSWTLLAESTRMRWRRVAYTLAGMG